MSHHHASPNQVLLHIENLSVQFGNFRAVDGLSLNLKAGETLGLVGESGSGKSVSMLALMGLIDEPGKVQADKLAFMQQDLLRMEPANKRKIIGKDIAMIFQDPMTSLNPSYTVEFQIAEVLKEHLGLRGDELRKRCIELLDLVEIPAPESRLSAYSHELSGGMSQRVMIAMAIACEPKLLIADEPTTALDVTIQAQIMSLLERLQKERHMALIMITHDLAVVAEVADHIAVMYAGQLVETGRIPAIFDAPQHPYTEALLASLPEFHLGTESRLSALPGIVPGQYDRPKGCLLSPRCPYVIEACRQTPIAMQDTPMGEVRCILPLHQDAAAKHPHNAEAQ